MATQQQRHTTMTPYQEFIAKSRYARYLEDSQRREHWPETTDRWIRFFKNELSDRIMEDAPIWSDIRQAIEGLRVLPSMRSVMTAGEALSKTNVAAYNCAYLPVDSPRSFDETMYILMCGTGVGFSVEAEYVDQLPTVPFLKHIDAEIDVADSREGWCEAFRTLLTFMWAGEIPEWNTHRVRPAGAVLKTFGGRASGPGPLEDLFHYVVAKFTEAQGRKLTPLEAHDIMCKIGEVVVVGGVRRSAMISLGDLEDQAHATAKSGGWNAYPPERALANNSAVYQEKPSAGKFMAEWLSIYQSNSGERGIFNREASQKQAAKFGRRLVTVMYGTNPCSEIILRPYQFCNLSTVVIDPDDTFEMIKDKVHLATIMGTMQATLTKFPYLRDIWRQNTVEESLLGVSMTGIYGNKWLVNAPNRDELLDELRVLAYTVNLMWSQKLGIPAAGAITCIKPEGTVSQLTLTESGIHPGHSPFYLRRVRQDNKDPLTQFLIRSGIPHEPCVHNPDTTTIFSFPQKSVGITRKDLTAIQHLEDWLSFQRHWCEHKPSVTISIKDHEWMEVGAWVYKHFDECTGISFLPYDGGHYQQAPYEEITEETYDLLVEQMPNINWNFFVEFSDNVEGAQTLACTAGGCAI